jgi:mRNA interferase MazF
VKQGEIYLVDLDPVVGSEAGGKNLVVVSTDAIGATFLPVTVALVRDAAGMPSLRIFGVLVPAAESGLTTDVVADCLQVRSLDRSRFAGSPPGVLSRATSKDVEKAL